MVNATILFEHEHRFTEHEHEYEHEYETERTCAVQRAAADVVRGGGVMNHPTTNLPPGPRGRWWPTLQLIRNPRKALSGWARQYGDPFLLRALNGPVVVTGRADLIKQIFGSDPASVGVFATGTTKPVLGAGSLLTMEGDEHRRERKLLMPLFSGERMKAYGQVMRQVALDRIERHRDGRPFRMLDVTTDVSLEVIVRVIFGGSSTATTQTLLSAAREVVERSSPLLFFSRKMHFHLGGWSHWDRFLAARERLFAALDHEIERADQVAQERTDILYQMRQAAYEDGTKASTEHLRQSLMTLLFAGHETSALALAWAFYHLHRNPESLARLKESLLADEDSAEAYARNRYLKGVVQESLRLHPIVTEVLRLPMGTTTLGEFELPAGCGIAAAAVLAHYHPETYPEPDAFRPQRFEERSFSPFEYFPFGGGHRRCIGAAFAMHEMAIVLASWLRQNDFELLEKRPVVPSRRNVTMGPSTGIAMRMLRPGTDERR